MENNIGPTDAPLQQPTGNKAIKKQLLVTGIFLFLAIVGLILFFILKEPVKKEQPVSLNQIPMILVSPSFKNDTTIPTKYTCDGTNVNPPLKFLAVPEKTASLVLIVDDPDSPSGNFTHWLVWNIDPTIQSIDENSYPAGAVQGLNDFRNNSYGGPCPSTGTHHYNFKLYALNTVLNLPVHSGKADLVAVMQGHIIAETKLIGLYSR